MFLFSLYFIVGNYKVMLISFLFSPVLGGRPSSKRSIHICGRPRWVFVLFFSAGVETLDLNFLKFYISPYYHSLQNWHHLFPWLQLAVYSGWPHAVFSQSSGHFSLLYLVWPVYCFEILCIMSNALMVFSVVHSNCAPCKPQNTKSESTSEYIQRGIPSCLEEL